MVPTSEGATLGVGCGAEDEGGDADYEDDVRMGGREPLALMMASHDLM